MSDYPVEPRLPHITTLVSVHNVRPDDVRLLILKTGLCLQVGPVGVFLRDASDLTEIVRRVAHSACVAADAVIDEALEALDDAPIAGPMVCEPGR